MTERKRDDEDRSQVKVTDRRLFDSRGKRREDAEAAREEEPAPAESAEEMGGTESDATETMDTADGVQYPAGFRALLAPFYVEALIHLGVEPHPETGQRSVDLDAARVPIDLLTLLEEKTRGNLTDAEAAELREALYQVRMIYVERSSDGTAG
jgi:hypothetical protein